MPIFTVQQLIIFAVIEKRNSAFILREIFGSLVVSFHKITNDQILFRLNLFFYLFSERLSNKGSYPFEPFTSI